MGVESGVLSGQVQGVLDMLGDDWEQLGSAHGYNNANIPELIRVEANIIGWTQILKLACRAPKPYMAWGCASASAPSPSPSTWSPSPKSPASSKPRTTSLKTSLCSSYLWPPVVSTLAPS